MSRLNKVVALANRASTEGERQAASLAAERLARLEGKEVLPTSDGIGVFDSERADLLRALHRIASPPIEVVVMDLATAAASVEAWGVPPSRFMLVFPGGRRL